MIVTSGVAVVNPGRVITEDMSQEDGAHPRQSEQQALIELQVSAVRLAPSVHGRGDKGFVPLLIDLARRTGVSAYIGEGNNCWPAVRRLDAARLYRLILETTQPKFAYHGIVEQGIPFKDPATPSGEGRGCRWKLARWSISGGLSGLLVETSRPPTSLLARYLVGHHNSRVCWLILTIRSIFKDETRVLLAAQQSERTSGHSATHWS